MDQLHPYRSFVSYIDRSREYYAAQGYTRPYAWPHYDDVPFTPLHKAACRVPGGIGDDRRETAKADRDRISALGAGAVRGDRRSPPPTRLFTDDLFWDKEATHTDDVDSFLPVNRLAEHAAGGRIGSASPRFYGVPTDYSQSRTIEQRRPPDPRMVPRGRPRRRAPRGALTGLPPDRESGIAAPGGERPADGGHGQRAGYRRRVRRRPLRIHRLSPGKSLRAALGRRDAARDRGKRPDSAGAGLDAAHHGPDAVSLGKRCVARRLHARRRRATARRSPGRGRSAGAARRKQRRADNP